MKLNCRGGCRHATLHGPAVHVLSTEWRSRAGSFSACVRAAEGRPLNAETQREGNDARNMELGRRPCALAPQSLLAGLTAHSSLRMPEATMAVRVRSSTPLRPTATHCYPVPPPTAIVTHHGCAHTAKGWLLEAAWCGCVRCTCPWIYSCSAPLVQHTASSGPRCRPRCRLYAAGLESLGVTAPA